MESHLKHPKYGIPLRIALTTGEAPLGLVFVQWGQRVRDLLCEKESFLPVRTKNGTLLVNKANVLHVDILTLEEITEKKDLFPAFDLDYLSRCAW